MNYSKKLISPFWQKRRLEILNRDNFTCQLCNDTDRELHVHHKEYITGHEPWEYPDENFITLCKWCHRITEEEKKLPLIVSRKEKEEFNRAIYMVITVDELQNVVRIYELENDTQRFTLLINLSEYTLNELISLIQLSEKLREKDYAK